MNNEIKEILDNPKILMLSYGNYISLDDYVKLKDYIINLQKENERLKKDLKTLWNVCWNNDTEMTSYQNEIFDNYYDEFHKLNGGGEE